MSRTVGTIKLHPQGAWVISAEPDIMIRLKRLLPGVKTHKVKSLIVSDTDVLGRELEWVLSRWNFEMTAEDRRHLGRRATADREREDLVSKVLAGTAQINPGVGWLTPALPLREYQRVATDLTRATGHTLLVDELGLGKTVMGLALLEDPAARPALAVTLTGLGRQWLREMNKFYPQLRGYELRTTKADKEIAKIVDRDGNLAYDLILCNYAKLAAWAPRLSGRVRTVIFDEIQELRRPESLKYDGARHIVSDATTVMGLSATPIYNRGGEILSVMDVISPGCLGTREEFLTEWSSVGYYGDPNGKVHVTNPAGLRAHLMAKGLFLRRTREDVGIALPAISTIEQFVSSDRGRFEELSGNAIEMAKLILSENASGAEKWRTAGDLDWRMRQATGVAKAPYVAEFVRLLLEGQDRVVLFGWHREVYDIWLERLREFRPVMYTGTESVAAKAKAFDEFVRGDSRVLIMSLRSGAGLDGLQDVASTLVFGELDWSPGVHRQAIGRLGRPGQTRSVLAYFCVSNDGSDPIILDTLNIKKMEADQLIEPETGAGSATPISSTSHVRKLAEAVLAAA
ncbi:helicase SNF2 [Mycobacterium sp. CBMA 213]|uniref:RNA polymerase-associated protein RapA n=1 Tax=Mycolicibacterium sp. CBMA 213 TaxID=1968788 RepID=A0A343VRP6_9MYCO|nr:MULTISPECIES: DEAD/DEAH box helicase [unclassified Mycolicibacterium]AVN58570.1 hypothetical protein B5P44_p00275 [Mycolicibacterium sp. CBMA 213]MUL61211.1 DEAD/DEAH box helicase [Mycolicibacterium sp. CBMA 335]MUM03448.1 helicase SNF2 [Mycolicibacterium sp. CBMA 213]